MDVPGRDDVAVDEQAVACTGLLQGVFEQELASVF